MKQGQRLPELKIDFPCIWPKRRRQSANSEGSFGGKTSLLFDRNFQSVSVGQKQIGYEASPSQPFTLGLLSAFNFVDASLTKIMAGLKVNVIYESTLIASKHCQTLINLAQDQKIDSTLITKAVEVLIDS